MNELRFVRREERSLILANESDDEFRLVIDDLLISELKHASRKEREAGKVRPREIQSLVRAGKSRSEIAALTGLEESDIERYEEPVLAERRYVLERAQAVQVRTDASDEGDQKFGAVIAERLIGLDADASEWAAWRDEETGWLISLEFISRDVAHRAMWSFDHRKQTLAPINPDAVSLSKHGDVGDRLIPKLRAVDNGDRTSQFAAVGDSPAVPTNQSATPENQAPAPEGPAALTSPAAQMPSDAPEVASEPPSQQAPADPTRPAAPPLDANAEYVRRREIDQRAIKTDDSGPVDFSQTADLLDALRRRRGERQLSAKQDPDDAETTPITTPPRIAPAPPEAKAPELTEVPEAPAPAAVPLRGLKKSRSIWGGAGVASGVTAESQRDAGSGPSDVTTPPAPAAPAPVAPVAPEPASDSAGSSARNPASNPTGDARTPKKGRASIPSWDDILFGTRSDEDPVT